MELNTILMAACDLGYKSTLITALKSKSLVEVQEYFQRQASLDDLTVEGLKAVAAHAKLSTRGTRQVLEHRLTGIPPLLPSFLLSA